MPDSNDIVFTSYGLNVRNTFEGLMSFFGADTLTQEAVFEFFTAWWTTYSVIAMIFSAIFTVGYIYSIIRNNQMSAIEQEKYIHAQERLYNELYRDEAESNTRLADLNAHIESDNPNEWKVAIIEADIILEEALDKAGFIGDTVGEKLKSATTTTLPSVQDAWDAHIIRNKVAHAGADFVLTHKIAREAITKYKKVFAELGAL